MASIGLGVFGAFLYLGGAFMLGWPLPLELRAHGSYLAVGLALGFVFGRTGR
jgi:hypothetical protein